MPTLFHIQVSGTHLDGIGAASAAQMLEWAARGVRGEEGDYVSIPQRAMENDSFVFGID
jgi:hypothetical protein